MHEKKSTNVQVIMRDGEAEYAVLPWADYQALLRAAGQGGEVPERPAPPAVTPTLAELVALREAQNMSQEQLARAVGISPSYLGMIETGERQPDSAIRRALARVLGIAEWEEDS
ncbi:helix-turn-helix domain-containing protein [Azotobacter chroococcum]|jgi:DNA-binding XRE family transcriptional regulator|uniref:Helix-turn-helix transcriptional regulator n=1 Tax=Azotobacter chroococcum TaxID=353 RepID=A0AAQ0BYI0_9GAMM|nr:helix-turn-helix transcriptional regulator [Azotobacter chroococcum]OHC12743.1 MAG: transcriptional regulator [Pseudomonadales bacterium GWC1_66_9]ASL27284.1 Cro/Cl family transcriptional regulator [Azotobacter chroococcum]MEE4462069.1 helix-turn-helix transcriptional regulator [Azotobacter chroococcum]QQE87615.1 helix-turn-helix transcriptional regulator [Azotobacter chroococcum]TKD29836.1 helix-turn-helix transcriptional regulator [Azotobacter chroococcum]